MSAENPVPTPTPRSARILVIDDHPIVRSGIAELLVRASHVVVAEASNAAQALTAVEKVALDLVLLDISLEGGMNGLELLKRLKLLKPGLPILVLSMHDEDLYGERALAAGAAGYIMKREATEVIPKAIERVLAGRTYASDKLTERLLRAARVPRPSPTSVERLSDRELEVLELIGRGLGTREIAESLHLSVKTIETYRANLKAKLAIDTSPQLVRFAVQWLETR